MSRNSTSSKGYESLLRNGLSSHRSYVVLREKTRSPAYLCFKPFLKRMSNTVVYVGGKLSIFPDTSHEAWSQLNDEEKQNLLIASWKALPQDRVAYCRIGSNAGFYVAAGKVDGEAFKSKFTKGHVVTALLDGIEEAMKTKIANRSAVSEFLKSRYEEQMSYVFSEVNGKPMPPRVVGKKSNLVIGQKFSLYGNPKVEEFMQKNGLSELGLSA